MASSEPPSTPSAQASSSTPIASPSTPSAADDAKAKREARKARILGKGSDRLNKLTKQARGEEAEMLYPSSDNTPSLNRTASNSTSTRAAAAVSPTGEEDPDDFDISNQGRMDGELQQAMQRFQEQQQQSQQTSQQQPQDPMQQMMAALMGGGGPGGQGGGMPDLSQLFAAMNGQNGEPQLGPDGQPLPPMDNPFAAFANMAGAGGGGGGGGGLFGPQGKVEATGKTLLDRLFSITHIVLFCLLGFFAISSSLSGGSSVGSSVDSSFVDKSASADEVVSAGRDSLLKWASLAYYRPGSEDAHHFRLDGSWLGLGSSVVSRICRTRFMALEALPADHHHLSA